MNGIEPKTAKTAAQAKAMAKTMAPISRRRKMTDRFGHGIAAFCGVGVITALAVMFAYLLYEAWPLAISPHAESLAHWSEAEAAGAADHSPTAAGFSLISQRGGRVLSFDAQGVQLYSMDAQEWLQPPQLEQLEPLFAAGEVAVIGGAPDTERVLVLAQDGRALIVRPEFELHWAEGERDYHKGEVRARLDLPLGKALLDTGLTLPQDEMAFAMDARALQLVAVSGRQMQVLHWQLRPSAFGNGSVPGRLNRVEVELEAAPQQLLLGRKGALYLLYGDGSVHLYRFADGKLRLEERKSLIEAGRRLGHAAMLLGDETLIVGDSSGDLSAWRSVSFEDAEPRLVRIRTYDAMPNGVARIVAEKGRKGFAVFGEGGGLGFYYLGTEDVSVLVEDSGFGAEGQLPEAAWFDATSRRLVATDGALWKSWTVDNEYPDTGADLLWSSVWYEGYAEPEYLWQSSSADRDFEPKFSLVPLLIGTLKGALYAMLFAVPIALMAAIYVARFMAPAARNYTKPAIEIMAAVPTVILGFIGALWLAPIAARNIIGVLLLFPLLLVLFAALPLLLRLVPARLRLPVPDGWEFVLSVPACIIAAWACLEAGPLLEVALFDGGVLAWADETLGILYEERNAFIVGIIMGFAVIPTIFSIAEDALFQAPKSLMDGGLALGATPWQCVSRIIVPTASPAIFSALMVGFGRAVGETMVVVMCTGNTPVTDWDIFSGMRTLSANIAVEMPEAELGSSHFRLLFLSALVLFALTFFFNTLAELVRGWLRQRYATL